MQSQKQDEKPRAGYRAGKAVGMYAKGAEERQEHREIADGPEEDVRIGQEGN